MLKVHRGIYDQDLIDTYTEEEWNKLDSWIDHDRDFLFTYAGLRQVVDKYLVQDRSTGELYETPQYMYMLISATIFAKYPKDTRRMDYVQVLQCNLKTQNQHPHTYHGRGANSTSTICCSCSC